MEHANDEDREGHNPDDEISVQIRKEEQNRLRRIRKAALDERKRQLENAWKNWEKPVLKPGDTVALLCPYADIEDGGSLGSRNQAVLTEIDRRSRSLLVNRSWTEKEERSSHILWVPVELTWNMEVLGCRRVRMIWIPTVELHLPLLLVYMLTQRMCYFYVSIQAQRSSEVRSSEQYR